MDAHPYHIWFGCCCCIDVLECIKALSAIAQINKDLAKYRFRAGRQSRYEQIIYRTLIQQALEKPRKLG